MLIVVALAEDEEAAPWMRLFAEALPHARFVRREPGQAVDATAAQADYVVIAQPCATLFLEQPAPRAVFTVSAGVGHVFRMPGFAACGAARAHRGCRHGAADGALRDWPPRCALRSDSTATSASSATRSGSGTCRAKSRRSRRACWGSA